MPELVLSKRGREVGGRLWLARLAFPRLRHVTPASHRAEIVGPRVLVGLLGPDAAEERLKSLRVGRAKVSEIVVRVVARVRVRDRRKAANIKMMTMMGTNDEWYLER